MFIDNSTPEQPANCDSATTADGRNNDESHDRIGSIRLGESLTASEFCDAIEAKGFKVTDEAKAMLESSLFVLHPVEEEVGLVTLGYDRIRSLRDDLPEDLRCRSCLLHIEDKLPQLGLGICSADAGPQFLLQLADTILAEEDDDDEFLTFVMVMDPIPNPSGKGNPLIFKAFKRPRKGGGSEFVLGTGYAIPGDNSRDTHWVLVSK